MHNRSMLAGGVVCGWMVLAWAGGASGSQPGDSAGDMVQSATVTEGFFGLGERLGASGVELGLAGTLIYQQNWRGGSSTHRRAGRFSGSYDLELGGDLERLAGLSGCSFHMSAEGSFSGGIDEPSIGSYFGVNGDAAGDRSMDVTQLWFEQSMSESLTVRLGKLDLTGGFEHRGCPVSFDCSMFANDETSQFLNGALVNNPTIPFSDYGLGVIVHYAPDELIYASVGAADSQADARQTGFDTAFHGEDTFLVICEAGVLPELRCGNGPLQGAYRVGVWGDFQPKANSAGAEMNRSHSDDVGFYVTIDQTLSKERSDVDDSQGMGAFFRYGYAHSRTNDMTNFWSVGLQYQGVLEARDDDVLGIGYAQGFFSDGAESYYHEDYESVTEIYYNAAVAAWLRVTPSLQYIAQPGGSNATGDAVALALRVQWTF